jgi:hypothetical protein
MRGMGDFEAPERRGRDGRDHLSRYEDQIFAGFLKACGLGGSPPSLTL